VEVEIFGELPFVTGGPLRRQFRRPTVACVADKFHHGELVALALPFARCERHPPVRVGRRPVGPCFDHVEPQHQRGCGVPGLVSSGVGVDPLHHRLWLRIGLGVRGERPCGRVDPAVDLRAHPATS
jgi:hypothetical protein